MQQQVNSAVERRMSGQRFFKLVLCILNADGLIIHRDILFAVTRNFVRPVSHPNKRGVIIIIIIIKNECHIATL